MTQPPRWIVGKGIDPQDPKNLRRLKAELVAGVLASLFLLGGVGWIVGQSARSDHLSSVGRVEPAQSVSVASFGRHRVRLDYQLSELPGRMFSAWAATEAWMAVRRQPLQVYVDPQDPSQNMPVIATVAPAWATAPLFAIPGLCIYATVWVGVAVRRLGRSSPSQASPPAPGPRP